MTGLSKNERKKLIEIIKSATTGEIKQMDEIKAVAVLEGYAEGTIQNMILLLSRCHILKWTLIRASDELNDALYGYTWAKTESGA